MEMFARYVIPQFQGYNATFNNEWEFIQAKTKDGKISRDTGGRSSNLTMTEPNQPKLNHPKLVVRK